MHSDNKIEGYWTNTTTMFGRHYPLFQKLENRLIEDKPSSVKCLIIGPGQRWEPDKDEKFTNTYQPYELINTLQRANIPDYDIDVLDINPTVIKEMQKSPTILKVCTNFLFDVNYHRIINLDEIMKSKKYYDSFFSSLMVDSTPDKKIIQLPEHMTSDIHAKTADIITYNLPKEAYDVVICTVLLSYYSQKFLQRWITPIPDTLKKIEDSVKPGGYLMDSQKGQMNKGWELLEDYNRLSKVTHNIGAGLFKKL